MKKLFFFVLFFSVANFAQNAKLDAFKKYNDLTTHLKYGEATKTLLAVYKTNPNDYAINLHLGWLYYVTKEYSTSEKYYNNAVKISSNSNEALLGLTLPLSAEGKWDKITEIYKSILDKDPHNYAANLRLGEIYLTNKNYLNAKILFEVVWNDLPSDFSANLDLGWTYYYLGNSSKANEFFTNALIVDPENPSAKEGFKLTK